MIHSLPNNYVTRIHLKRDRNRAKLIDFCLHTTESKTCQYLAIGWSCIYPENADSTQHFSDYEAFYNAIKCDKAEKGKNRINPAINIFHETKENDLFWTRDLNGFYWICRALDCAKPHYDNELDIGAIVPVEAYKVGTEVPGQIKASFNRANGGVVQKIRDSIMIEYSKFIFNKMSKKQFYEYTITEGDLLDNLPDFDLEELIISYLQIKKDYYLLSNSIAKKSTTIKVECELISRNTSKPEKAVVQVKGGTSKTLCAEDYENYLNDGYIVYLYAPNIITTNENKNIQVIQRDELIEFYHTYKAILPKSITCWENLFRDHEKLHNE